MNVDFEVAPEFGPIEPKPQPIAVADAIQAAIALGRYGPGDRLPPERELAALLGVGRMTLRAAIRQLNEDGLVATTRGRSGGTVVNGSRPRLNSQQELVLRCVDEIRKNYEFRLAVEPCAASLSANRASRKQQKIIAELAAAEPESVAHYRTLDSRFHLVIGESCGNRLLLEAVRRARADFFVWADALWVLSESLSEETEMSGSQHVGIAKAIAEGDSVAAARTMSLHLEWARTSFLSRISVADEHRAAGGGRASVPVTGGAPPVKDAARTKPSR